MARTVAGVTQQGRRRITRCTLLYSLEKKAKQVYKTFTFSDQEDPNDYETDGETGKQFCAKSEYHSRESLFPSAHQKDQEMVEEYIRSLHELANTCAFADAKEENICDRLVIGIIDKSLSEKLQLMPDLMLNKAVELVRTEQIMHHVIEQGASANCAQVSEVACKHLPYRDKQRYNNGHGRYKGAKVKQASM